jgi:NAD(P)-dependent dehydrogenase (short-subunit alcohol dehydrogenase family)
MHDDPLFSVAEQTVLVSGGSRGIGKAIAAGFARRGARVLITGRDAGTLEAAAREISAGPHPVRGLACDVAEIDQVERLVRRVRDQCEHVDTLVNVAGVNRRKPAESIAVEDYDFVLDINLKGAFFLSQRMGQAMLQRGQGCQINIVSLNSDRPLKHVSPYAMSKAGMTQMTRALALEWGDRGIRVNAIAPGFILTDLTRGLWSDKTMRDWGEANTPQRRLGVPEDLVGPTLFLASSAASFVTGQVLYVDGGFTAGWAWPIPG